MNIGIVLVVEVWQARHVLHLFDQYMSAPPLYTPSCQGVHAVRMVRAHLGQAEGMHTCMHNLWQIATGSLYTTCITEGTATYARAL